jgi:hypothetical protein
MKRAKTPFVLAGVVWAALLAAQPAAAVPIFTLSASCTPSAQGTFTITNTGTNMTGPGTWTLNLNGTPIATNSFQLNAGASTSINTSGLFGTLDLFVSGGGAAPKSISTFCQSPTPTPTVTPIPTPTPPPGTSYHTVPPCRAVDTRNAVAPLGGPVLQPLEVRPFKLAGSCGVPLSARSVSVNVTAVPAGSGVFVMYPGNEPNPGTSTLNFLAGVVRANNAFVLLATDGSGGANVFNGSAAANHVVVDVNGYFQ